MRVKCLLWFGGKLENLFFRRICFLRNILSHEMDSEPGAGADRRTGYRREDKEPRLWVGVRTSLVARVNHQAMSEVGT